MVPWSTKTEKVSMRKVREIALLLSHRTSLRMAQYYTKRAPRSLQGKREPEKHIHFPRIAEHSLGDPQGSHLTGITGRTWDQRETEKRRAELTEIRAQISVVHNSACFGPRAEVPASTPGPLQSWASGPSGQRTCLALLPDKISNITPQGTRERKTN